MRKLVFALSLIVFAGILPSFIPIDKAIANTTTEVDEYAKVKWYTWEEAIQASERNPKKIFVDVYTEWCGWCKKMDRNTFAEKNVAAYLNKNFYPVKFDAEQKADVKYKGSILKFHADAGRRGVHELAHALLDGRMSYPSYVYLDENQGRITISPGYKEAKDFIKELVFISDNHYKTTTFDAYMKGK